MSDQRYYQNFDPKNSVLNRQYNYDRTAQQRNSNIGNDLALSQKYGLSYALGQLAGSLMDDYNNRGINKANGELNEFMNNYGRPQPKQQQPQGILSSIGTTDAPDEVKDIASQNSVNDVTAPADSIGMGVQPISVRDQMAIDKRQHYVDKYLNGPSENPDGDAMKAKQDGAELDKMSDQIDWSQVSYNNLRQQAHDYLKSKGRTEYQIEEALKNFDGMYKEKLGRFHEQKATQYLDKAKDLLGQGRFNEADMQILAAYPHAPSLANAYSKFSGTARANKMREDALAMRMSRGYGGSGGSSGAGTPSGSNDAVWIGRKDAITRQDYQDAMSSLKYLNGKEKLTEDEARQKEYLEKLISTFNTPGHGAVRGYNINSPQDVQNYLRGVAYNLRNDPKTSGTDVLNTIKNDGIMSSPYWDDRYLEMLGLSSDSTNIDIDRIGNNL